MRRNCLSKYIIEGKIQGRIEVTSRRKQLLNVLKETKRFWKLKVEALDCCIVVIVVLCSWSGRPSRPRTQHDYHHDTKVKPEAATAVI
jgi:hypothetical protein